MLRVLLPGHIPLDEDVAGADDGLLAGRDHFVGLLGATRPDDLCVVVGPDPQLARFDVADEGVRRQERRCVLDLPVRGIGLAGEEDAGELLGDDVTVEGEVEEWRGPENFRGNEVKSVADASSDLLLLDKAKPDKDYFAKLKADIQDVLDKPRP